MKLCVSSSTLLGSRGTLGLAGGGAASAADDLNGLLKEKRDEALLGTRAGLRVEAYAASTPGVHVVGDWIVRVDDVVDIIDGEAAVGALVPGYAWRCGAIVFCARLLAVDAW